MIYHFLCSLPPHISSAYTVIRKTVWKIADSNHIIIFIKNGNCRIKVDNKNHILKSGDIFFIPAGTSYTRSPVNNEFCEIVYVHFTVTGKLSVYENSDLIAKEFSNHNLTEFYTKDKFSIFLPASTVLDYKSEKAFQLTSQTIRSMSGNSVFDIPIAEFSFCTLLLLISKAFMSDLITQQVDADKQNYPTALKKALSYIKKNYAEHISLEDLCKVSFVSKQMLIKHFNKYIGKSPTSYIIEYRIDCVKSFLSRYPDMSIKEICSEFGFEDQCYFSRIFRKYTGESPTEYRNRIANFNQAKHLAE